MRMRQFRVEVYTSSRYRTHHRLCAQVLTVQPPGAYIVSMS
jgi:hypothetical protein